MDAPKRSDEISVSVEPLELPAAKFTSKVEVLSIGIENADILVVAGRDVKT